MSLSNKGDRGNKRSKGIQEKVLSVLDEIRPALQADGGDLKLVKISKNELTIRILGACLSCPYSQMTFGEEMEKEIKKKVPEIEKIKFIS